MSLRSLQTAGLLPAQVHRHRQRGGTAMGVIIGLLIGLGLALIVALYVTRVPVPFVNKVPQRSAEQEAAEADRSRQWDPNAKLGNSAGRSAATAATPAASGAVPPYVPPVPPATTATTPPTASTSTPAAKAPTTAPAAPAVATSTTTGPSAKAPASATPPTVTPTAATKPGADPFTYFVQAGAYTRQEDAEQQRAKLAMMGFSAKVTEREQVGRTMYRVRLGPFESKDSANTAQGKLQQGGVDAALVAVERNPR